ncbi:MAG: efflux RND transporter periplasmic adaptor subunit [Candidatus Eisenbacteria bacterium]|nr:efflux RND transporter periplasmic adaptor subunit [Candidatus Eisenbacteria bacterium]
MKRSVRTFWLPLCILAGAGLVAAVIANTGPESPRRVPQRQARLVEVLPLERNDVPVVIEAMGTVTAARSVELRAIVGGEVVEVSESFVPGGVLAEGETILRIDRRDYDLAVRQREDDLAKAEENRLLEEGRQAVARREYELLGEDLSESEAELVLRRPQLETARSARAAAAASLDQALLDRERTRITAPFNAVVEEKHVDKGTVLSANTVIADLAGTDVFWLEVPVPADELRWIRIPEGNGDSASTVWIRQDTAWDEGERRSGRVLRRLGSLEAEGRMARLLVEVEDPLSLRPENAGKPVLLMNAFVRVEILGRTLRDVVAVNRRHVHDGSTVWLMDEDNLLRIRKIKPVYVGEDRILAAEGLETGERLVTTEIGAPVEGMPLRVQEGVSGEAPGDGAEEAESR